MYDLNYKDAFGWNPLLLGPTGPIGSSGERGMGGAVGITGPTGALGPTGPMGRSGSMQYGPTGPQAQKTIKRKSPDQKEVWQISSGIIAIDTHYRMNPSDLNITPVFNGQRNCSVTCWVYVIGENRVEFVLNGTIRSGVIATDEHIVGTYLISIKVELYYDGSNFLLRTYKNDTLTVSPRYDTLVSSGDYYFDVDQYVTPPDASSGLAICTSHGVADAYCQLIDKLGTAKSLTAAQIAAMKAIYGA